MARGVSIGEEVNEALLNEALVGGREWFRSQCDRHFRHERSEVCHSWVVVVHFKLR